MKFELPTELPSIIKVIGVGGGGSNAVNHMFRQGIQGVEFLVCNTDLQALEMSPIPHKVQLGSSLTEGRGAGSMPEVGKHSAMENIEDLRKALSDHTKMVFITAGMGGGTGTGAAPIIADLAREMGILTVAIVTIPFSFEGKKRKAQAEAGIEELKRCVDTLLVICNDKLREIHGDLRLTNAFSEADSVLATAARSIAEIISKTLHINVDFADVETVMKKSGRAIMGSAISSGENRAIRAVELALDSPLLDDNNIEGAKHILLNITSGDEEITMDEMSEITEFIQEKSGQTAEVIMGVGTDDSLGEKISVTIIATGFKTKEQIRSEKPVERIVHTLEEEENKATIAEVFSLGDQALVPTLITEDETEEDQADGLDFVDEEKVYETERNDPVIYSLGDDLPVPAQTDEIHVPDPAATADTDAGIADEPVTARHDDLFALTDEPEAMPAPEKPVADVPDATDENVFTFEVGTTGTGDIPEPPREVRADPEPAPPAAETPTASDAPAPPAADAEPEEDRHEELFRRAKERIMKLKEMSIQLSSPSLTDLENEPAFRRRNIKLDDVPSSSNRDVSRFTLVEDENKKVEIKRNSFLHDKAD